MSKVKKFIIFILIFLVITIVSLASYRILAKDKKQDFKMNKNDITDKETPVVKPDNELDNEIENSNKETNQENFSEDSEVNTQENIKQDNNKTESIRKEPIIKPEQNNSTPSQKKEETSNPTNTTNPIPNKTENSEVVDTPMEELKAWEQLGLTEDQYYNKPMWSWARIDYSVDNYSSREETRKACQLESMRLLEEGISSGCTEINSYSGRYLGEMLEKMP